MTDSSTSGFTILLGLLALGLALWAYGRIARKAGYSAAWGLAVVVPVLNVVMLVVFAVSTWPVEREVEELHRQLRREREANARTAATAHGMIAPSGGGWPRG